MAFFADQVGRILRTRWKDPQSLAEEIAAIFNSDKPIKITSPIELVGNADGVPPLTIVTQTLPNGDPVDPIVFNIGGLTIPESKSTLPAGTEPLQSTTTGGGNAFAGQVVSGTGITYSCRIWSGPTTGASLATVNVEMKNLAADAVLPAGSWLVVLKLGTQYVGFPPAFLGP